MTVAVENRKPIVVSSAALRRAGFKSGQDLEFNGGITSPALAPAGLCRLPVLFGRPLESLGD